MDTQSLTISSALEQMRAGSLSPSALAEACFAAAQRLNPDLNAYITLLPLSTSRQSTFEGAALAGIPIAVKDLYQTAGIRTTAGTSFFKDFIPDQDAAVVEKLKTAGAVLTGKTNTHEIALGLTGVNPHFGPARNPWNRLHITGGSSSGSAAAVAAGLCLAAMGTDTGGSIRIPASLCGVVGLKPTFGRISLRGVFPLSWNLDHAGPLTKTVRDAALLLGVLAGYDQLDPASLNVPPDDYISELDAGVKGWRIAVLDNDYAREAQPEVVSAVQAAAGVFKTLGARVEGVDLSFLREAAQANGVMVVADAAAFHRDRLRENPEGFGADVRQRLQGGAATTSTEYALARRAQAEMRRRMEFFFQDWDLLLLPATPMTASLIDEKNVFERNRPLTRFTAPFNLTGLPALSIPCGFSLDGLPIGLQIVAPAWAEKKLLQAGHAFEQATEWHLRRPNL